MIRSFVLGKMIWVFEREHLTVAKGHPVIILLCPNRKDNHTMNDLRTLEQKLAANLDWHGARIKFLARIITALITTRTVNLAALASVFDGPAQTSSHYQTCHRFLKAFELALRGHRAVHRAVAGGEHGWRVALDRTNWKFGKTDLNLLMLALIHEGIAYPLIWLSLDKAGNSHTDERILLLELFLSLFDIE